MEVVLTCRFAGLRPDSAKPWQDNRITKAQDRVYRTCGSTRLVGQVSLRRIGSEHCISKGGECHSNSRLRRDLRALCSLDGMPKVRTFNCDSRFAPIFLSYAKSISCKHEKIQSKRESQLKVRTF